MATALELAVGLDVIQNYKRLSYKVWYALAEFVDNSTQSYFNNRKALEAALKKEKKKLEVQIVYDKQTKLLRVSDTAMGMSLNELENALRIGHPPKNRSGRSQFGMGLKTAAFWFGNKWSIRTKKLGETVEHFVTIDAEKIVNGNGKLPHTEAPNKKAHDHYTVVEISDLNVSIQGRTLNRTKDFLSSMYRVDVRDGLLDLYWQGSRLPPMADFEFMEAADGEKYRMTLKNLKIDGKRVEGWLGILGPGSSGRPNAGFTIIRRGRVIRGWPDSWRPESIFGQWQGTNDLINQRIAGEIILDDFAVSHTKDDILWLGGQEDELQQKLAELATDYIAVARTPRKRGEKRGPTAAEVQTAVDELKTELESKEFIDLIEIDAVPPPEVIEKSNKPMIVAAKKHEPQFVVTVGTSVVKLYLTTDASPNDLYFNSDVAGQSISVIVNIHHPHWAQLSGAESVLTYLRQCVYDAVAEWHCRRKTSGINSATIKLLKDSLLRLPSRIEQACATSES